MAKTNDHISALTGKLLLAMPTMADPRFHRAVIFICAHDANGAMGLVINNAKPEIAFSDLLEQLGIISDIELSEAVSPAVPVMSGGPVESARGFLLHSNDFRRPDTIRIDDVCSVTGTLDALRDVATGKGPDRMLFILGYAGWSAGQLEQELQDNAWLVIEPDAGIIFHPDAEKKWLMSFEKLGFPPAMLSSDSGRA